MRRIWTSLTAIIGLALYVSSCSPAEIYADLFPDPTSTLNRAIEFCGETWYAKDSNGYVGPGPNFFSSAKENVFVDEQGRLHLKISKQIRKGVEVWTASEIVSKRTFGYGKYTFYLEGDLGNLNENVVLGMFTWSDNPDFSNREIDIEFTRWGKKNGPNGQYAVWPLDSRSRYQPFRFDTDENSKIETSLIWRPDALGFKTIVLDPDSEASSQDENEWKFEGDRIPPSLDEKVHMNLWLFGSKPPSDNEEVEVIVSCFKFDPSID